jgi:transposase
MPVICASTGEIRTAQIFVAVLGASNYTFAEATWSQSLPDWLGSHVRAFEFFGGTPVMLVPDNLKSGVNKACRYEPELNPGYQQLAAHYAVAVVPARPYKPKDKAKAEAGVQLVERWIMAKLRHQTFFSLAELNHCISALLTELNQKPFKQMPGSRQQWFETLDQPAPVTVTEVRLSVHRHQISSRQYRLSPDRRPAPLLGAASLRWRTG